MFLEQRLGIFVFAREWGGVEKVYRLMWSFYTIHIGGLVGRKDFNMALFVENERFAYLCIP